MYYPTTPAGLWMFLFIFGGIIGLLCYFIGLAIWKALDAGRAWIITVPDVPGQLATIERRRRGRGTFTRKAENSDDREKIILAGDAAYPTRRGPLHLLTYGGANLVAPTKDDASSLTYPKNANAEERKNIFQRFRVWDPVIYWRACRENDMEDFYAAQQDKDHWIVKVAPLAFIAVAVLSLMLMFLLWKLMPLLNQAG